jgi:hypothetical protein
MGNITMPAGRTKPPSVNSFTAMILEITRQVTKAAATATKYDE